MTDTREALFSLLGAASSDRPDVAYAIEVSAGGEEWRLVSGEPLVMTRDEGLDRVRDLNARVELLAEGIVALAGLELSDLVHSYRVVEVALDFDPPEALSPAEEFERQYGPTLRQIKDALAVASIKSRRVRVMSDALGLIVVPLKRAEQEDRGAAQAMLDALVAVGYTGSVKTFSRSWASQPDFFEVHLVGPFPLIEGS